MAKLISSFEWDAANLAHCRKHGVSMLDIMDAFTRPLAILPDARHSRTEQRFRAIGLTSRERFVFVVFAIREHDGRTYIRPIAARFMHRKEIARYEKDNPDI